MIRSASVNIPSTTLPHKPGAHTRPPGMAVPLIRCRHPFRRGGKPAGSAPIERWACLRNPIHAICHCAIPTKCRQTDMLGGIYKSMLEPTSPC